MTTHKRLTNHKSFRRCITCSGTADPMPGNTAYLVNCIYSTGVVYKWFCSPACIASHFSATRGQRIKISRAHNKQAIAEEAKEIILD